MPSCQKYGRCQPEDLEGTLSYSSLPVFLPQPPSAELFHYDSTNAVNWGMRGKVPQSWGAAQAGDPVGMELRAMGLPTSLQAALENEVQAGGRSGEMGRGLQP